MVPIVVKPLYVPPSGIPCGDQSHNVDNPDVILTSTDLDFLWLKQRLQRYMAPNHHRPQSLDTAYSHQALDCHPPALHRGDILIVDPPVEYLIKWHREYSCDLCLHHYRWFLTFMRLN